MRRDRYVLKHWLHGIFAALLFCTFFAAPAIAAKKTRRTTEEQHELNEQLCLAAKIGEGAYTRQLLAEGADVNAKDDRYWSPLHYAAAKGREQVARLLLKHGARINEKSDFDETPLYLAADNAHAGLVRLLLKQGAQVDSKNVSNFSPLDAVAFDDNPEILEVLLKQGARCQTKFTDSKLLLQEAVEKGATEVVRLLLKQGVRPNVKDDAGCTPLHNAASQGNTEILRLLLKHGAKVDVKNDGRYTPLHFAASKGNTEAVRLLLQHGANIVVQDGARWTPLQWAISKNHTETARLLLEHAIRVGTEIRGINSLLFDVVKRGNSELTRLLLSHGANVNVKDSYRSTPLHAAVIQGHTEIVRLLLEQGAHIDAKNDGNLTPLNVALARKEKEMASFLRLAESLLGSDNLNREKKVEAFHELWGEAAAAELRQTDPQAFTHIALRAAETASALAAEQGLSYKQQLKETTRLFVRLFNQDVARAKQTTGGVSKYAEHLQSQRGQISNIKDLRNEIASSLVLPVRLSARLKPIAQEELKQQDGLARRLVARRLAHGYDTLNLHRFNRAWHHNNQLPDLLMPLKRNGDWYPLFEGEQPLKNGLTIVALNKGSSLVAEGKALNHCVGEGEYAGKGLLGESHLLSIRRNGEPVATIELKRTDAASAELITPDGVGWRVAQMHASYNHAPTRDVRDAWNAFAKQLWQQKGPTLTAIHGETQESKLVRRKTRGSALSRKVGFPINEADTYLPKILAHYQTRVSFEYGRPRTIEGQQEKVRDRKPLISARTAKLITRRIEAAKTVSPRQER